MNDAYLPFHEMTKAICADDAAERFIAGTVDFERKSILLVKGNFGTITIPFSWFESSGDGTTPDFSRLGFTDYGYTVVFGEYEAAADAILDDHERIQQSHH